MNWEAICAIGEIVGALAVNSTLVYLALQVRRGAAISVMFLFGLTASDLFRRSMDTELNYGY
ncbi:MAG: hypothetical protein ACI9ON_002315 [Limisphaerales bacterium]|jgi:hypothetical protein